MPADTETETQRGEGFFASVSSGPLPNQHRVRLHLFQSGLSQDRAHALITGFLYLVGKSQKPSEPSKAVSSVADIPVPAQFPGSVLVTKETPVLKVAQPIPGVPGIPEKLAEIRKTKQQKKPSVGQKLKTIAACNNKFGIPVDLYQKDKKKYQRIWSQCNKLDIMYEEALLLEGRTVRGTPLKEILAIVRAEQQTKSESDKNSSENRSRIDKPVPDIKTVPFSVTMDKTPKSELVVGRSVRQIKPDQGRQIQGNGVVTARRGDLVEVRDGGGKKSWIVDTCLELITDTEVSDRASGRSS